MDAVRVIYGVDFSGAKDAGNKIWISNGASKGKGLLVKKCIRGRDLTSSGKWVEDCLAALVTFVKSEASAVYGFDFPFGLPDPLVEEKTWEDFVLAFPKR